MFIISSLIDIILYGYFSYPNNINLPISAPTEYTHTYYGACCISSTEQHEGCEIHSSFAEVSEATCRAACDNDNLCKGFSMRNVNGGKFCRLATAPTHCPYSWNILTGANGNLDQYAYCEPQFSGCQMKQDGNNIKNSRLWGMKIIHLKLEYRAYQFYINDR